MQVQQNNESKKFIIGDKEMKHPKMCKNCKHFIGCLNLQGKYEGFNDTCEDFETKEN